MDRGGTRAAGVPEPEREEGSGECSGPGPAALAFTLRRVEKERKGGGVTQLGGRSGKSTLLRVLMTLDPPTSGDIEIDGEPMWTDAQGR